MPELQRSVRETFGLAKRLCLDMDAGANRDDDQLVEVRQKTF